MLARERKKAWKRKTRARCWPMSGSVKPDSYAQCRCGLIVKR